MAGMPNPGLLSVRPSLTRSRSNTSPVNPSNLSIETSALAPQEPFRPSHSRSKSYIAPVEHKLQSHTTLPSQNERPTDSSRFPRIHLHGKHHQPPNDDPKVPLHRRHRFLQSENQQYHRRNDTKTQDSLSSPADGHHGMPPDTLYPASRGAAIPSLMRMRSYRSYRGGTNTNDEKNSNNHGNTRGRANSDPKSPTHLNEASTPKSPIELQLERSDLLRYAAHQNATQEDVDRLSTRLENAKVELSTRCEKNTDNATALMLRLDHVHDTLHRTNESLTDTLSSFSNLAQQSSKLLSNFESETANLDASLRARLRRFRNDICTKRADRVSRLEKRGEAVNQKAEDLGRRLENCRTIVKNWEARETKKQRTWKGVRDGIFWSLILILIGVLAGVLSWKAVQFNDGKGTPEEVLSHLVKNESWGMESLAAANIPDDVRSVLQDIAARGQNGVRPERSLRGGGRPKQPANIKDDRRVRLLDEL